MSISLHSELISRRQEAIHFHRENIDTCKTETTLSSGPLDDELEQIIGFQRENGKDNTPRDLGFWVKTAINFQRGIGNDKNARLSFWTRKALSFQRETGNARKQVVTLPQFSIAKARGVDGELPLSREGIFFKRHLFSYRRVMNPAIRQLDFSWHNFLFDQKLIDCQPKHSKDQISERWGHALLYKICEDIPGFKCYSGKKALEIILKGFSLRCPISIFENENMRNAIRALPTQLTEDELQVLSYRIPAPIEKNESSDSIFYHFFYKNIYFMPMIIHDDKGVITYEVLIFPPLLFRQLLKNRFPSTVMIPVPVLGYRPKIKLSDPARRVVSISTPFAPAPDIHGSKYELHPNMYWHDMYHLFIESANPHRKAWLEVHQILLKTPPDLFNEEYLEKMKVKCLDREFTSYNFLNSYRTDPDFYSKNFWKHLAFLPLPNALDCLEWIKPDGLGNYVLDRLKEVALEQNWKERFKIDVQDVDNQNIAQIFKGSSG